MIQELKDREYINQSEKLDKAYQKLQKLIKALNERDIPDEISSSINSEIQSVDTLEGTDKELTKGVMKSYRKILKIVSKELKLVTPNYYRTLWMTLGMSAFGLPIGLALSTGTDNFGLLGVGLPIGMVIGMAVGSGMDKKAKEEGRQLTVGSS